MGRVLIACEFSGIVREAFKAQGHDAWSCDFLDTEIPGQHYKCDVLDVLNKGWDLMIAHPPCTYLANSGVSRLYSKKTGFNKTREWQMIDAGQFFQELFFAKIDKICIENPIPHKYARKYMGKYDQIIQPWQYGHGETKATCLWLQNLPKLVPTNIVNGREGKIIKMGPSPDRWKDRSRTYTGIAEAFATQYGALI